MNGQYYACYIKVVSILRLVDAGFRGRYAEVFIKCLVQDFHEEPRLLADTVKALHKKP